MRGVPITALTSPTLFQVPIPTSWEKWTATWVSKWCASQFGRSNHSNIRSPEKYKSFRNWKKKHTHRKKKCFAFRKSHLNKNCVIKQLMKNFSKNLLKKIPSVMYMHSHYHSIYSTWYTTITVWLHLKWIARDWIRIPTFGEKL